MDKSFADTGMRPTGVALLAVLLLLFGLFAFFGSLFLWGQGFLLHFPAGVDYAFPVADLLINAPASLLAAWGLWKMRRWAYAAACFVAGFYIYASVEIIVMLLQGGPPYAIEILLPQALALGVGAVLVLYLWPRRHRFTS